MNVRAVLRECAVDLLDTEPHVTVEQIVGCAYRRHGDSFVEAQQQMVLAAAREITAKLMRDLTDDDAEQLNLPGIPTENGTYYVLGPARLVGTPDRTCLPTRRASPEPQQRCRRLRRDHGAAAAVHGGGPGAHRCWCARSRGGVMERGPLVAAMGAAPECPDCDDDPEVVVVSRWFGRPDKPTSRHESWWRCSSCLRWVAVAR